MPGVPPEPDAHRTTGKGGMRNASAGRLAPGSYKLGFLQLGGADFHAADVAGGSGYPGGKGCGGDQPPVGRPR